MSYEDTEEDKRDDKQLKFLQNALVSQKELHYPVTNLDILLDSPGIPRASIVDLSHSDVPKVEAIKLPDLSTLNVESPFMKSHMEHMREKRRTISKTYIKQEPEKSKKSEKRGLSSSQKNNIRLVFEECEYRGCHRAPHEVHHINEDKTDNSYKNLIVLCGACHDDAHGKNPKKQKIPREKLSGVVKRRATNKEKRIKEILNKKPNNRKKPDNNNVQLPSYLPKTTDIIPKPIKFTKSNLGLSGRNL
jgi:5-methylcytosine-specific restriction endonuclease McrA